jgi:uncharacterized protein YqgC (DUF456 family)
MTWGLVLVMLVALFLIPIGLPGIWIMLAVVLYGAFVMHQISMIVLLAIVVIAAAAELIEFLFVKRLTKQYGGSRKSFWGAMAGGVIGAIVGTPIPVFGSVIGALVGSFIGAAIITFAETKELGAAHRVGWGAVIGRTLGAVTKTAAGLIIFLLAAAALLRH